MKKVGAIWLGLLCCIGFVMTVNTAAALAHTAHKAGVKAVPVTIFGKTLAISCGMTRAEAKAELSAIIKDKPSLDTAGRLQYDVPLVPDQAPVSILFDFDKKGMVIGFMLDAYDKAQSPPSAALVSWLGSHAKKSMVKTKESTTWIFGGWKIEHIEGGSGEDSAYTVEFTRIGK